MLDEIVKKYLITNTIITPDNLVNYVKAYQLPINEINTANTVCGDQNVINSYDILETADAQKMIDSDDNATDKDDVSINSKMVFENRENSGVKRKLDENEYNKDLEVNNVCKKNKKQF